MLSNFKVTLSNFEVMQLNFEVIYEIIEFILSKPVKIEKIQNLQNCKIIYEKHTKNL